MYVILFFSLFGEFCLFGVLRCLLWLNLFQLLLVCFIWEQNLFGCSASFWFWDWFSWSETVFHYVAQAVFEFKIPLLNLSVTIITRVHLSHSQFNYYLNTVKLLSSVDYYIHCHGGRTVVTKFSGCKDHSISWRCFQKVINEKRKYQITCYMFLM